MRTEKSWFSEPLRDPYSLVYISHPSKGLSAAIEVLNLLREKDKRFFLHVFGGDALWGGNDKTISIPGVVYHGTQGQQNVFKSLLRANISLNLQERLEPFGMVVTEAMKHGCIPIASPVGAYSETIKHGYNGFLIPGDHSSTEVHRQAADTIIQIVQAPHYAEYLRKQAMQMPWTWDTQARVWEQHWDWVLGEKGVTMHTAASYCRRCKGTWLLAADGYHCTTCGYYSQDGNG
jgi:glycosyltransferase involved in cell wall biosynthesis